MNVLIRKCVAVVALLLLTVGCAAQQPKSPTSTQYPRKPADNPERKSGPAMLFLEAAEKDADPENVIVIPPDQVEKKPE